MCSISWQLHPKGYDLFFTRDEQRSRVSADKPSVHETRHGIRYLAPTDPQGGGTWIFVNAHGLSGALLNAYELTDIAPQPAAPQSRGQLLRSLTPSDTVESFGRNLKDSVARHSYPPCYLMAFGPTGTVGFWLWNGRKRITQPLPESQFFTTSSVQSVEVRASRSERFARELGPPPLSPAAMECFHRDEASRLSAFDVRMSRPDARSVSLTHICHRREANTMHYAPREGDGFFAPFAPREKLEKSKETRATGES
ncbi:MAG: NRDE family protein [Opitutales bacterium]